MIRLFLLGKKGLIALQGLQPEYLQTIETVVIGRDPNVQNDYFLEISTLCTHHKLKFIERKEHIDPKSNTVNIAIGWRWLIKSKSKIIVFHDSILPRYRGFNPLVTALINGDREIGVTALIGENEFDKGPIIGQQKIQISYPLTIQNAIEKIARKYAALLNKVIKDILNNSLVEVSQNDFEATYSLWRDVKDYQINWSKPAVEIERFIHAVGYPYAGAFSFVNGEKIIFKEAESLPDLLIENRTPGKVLFKHKKAITIVCGEGLLKVSSLFKENGEEYNNTNFRIRFE